MKKYDPKKIEQKWKKYWDKHQVYKTQEISDKPKYYVLDMFPYPSGAGLHVGHPKGYIATDVIARMKMMQGYNVLHPMGWDAFGLPAENYAIKNKVHPKEAVDKNITTFKKQLGMLGFTYDWDREINTTDSNYYKWTQWIFLQMFNRGLAYESFEPVNWCPVDKTVLANEDLENGRCERCGSVVERRPMRQWVLRITRYADRLLNDLELLKEWPEHIKEMQRNWIGRSEGAIVKFPMTNYQFPINDQFPISNEYIEVFTTRPDTLFGATYMVVAPEHSLIANSSQLIANRDEVNAYVEQAKRKTDLERTELQKDKNGVEIKGLKAVNPVNGEELPIFVADYVLGGYGTGAIMAVPAHDQRDMDFARKYGLPVKGVVAPKDGIDSLLHGFIDKDKAYEMGGINVDSEFLDGFSTSEAKEKMIQWLEEKGVGKREVQYKIRDWVFSRQRYWGEPIPLVKCENCGWVPVPEDQLPVELPKVKHYEPTGTGESPLANIPEFVDTTCPKCGGPAKRETNTMPQWAGSCWYYLAYVMRAISNFPFLDRRETFSISNYSEAFDYWQPVDLYVGGAEHATRHLIYARFWHKFLYDIGAVKNIEPFTRLQSVGLILAEDGRKMSKRWGNVINPDDIVKEFGADSMRVYEMFMGPFSQPVAWNTQGLVGMRRFLERVWALFEHVIPSEVSDDRSEHSEGSTGIKAGTTMQGDSSSLPRVAHRNDTSALLHQTIKKVTDDIEGMRFNTAIAKMMELVNEMARQDSLFTFHFSLLVKLLSPFAPHMTQELWEMLGNKTLLINEPWPTFDPELAKESELTLAVQVNGKLRDTIVVPADINEEDAKRLALESEKVRKWLEGKEPKKVIYVNGKLVSIVV